MEIPHLTMLCPIVLLLISNIFMTFAWYGHLKDMKTALLDCNHCKLVNRLFEYCFQVPANRAGAQYFSLPQLKVLQIITMIVFAGFSVAYMKVPVNRNYFFSRHATGRCLT